jgi:hypothetical protein
MEIMKKHRMPEHGQSFGVFKLLVAAIIALSVLIILLHLLGKLPVPIEKNPTIVIANTIRESSTKIIFYKHTPKVTMSPGQSVVAKAVANAANVGLTPEQICLSTGDFKNSSEFELAPPSRITYKGHQPKDVRFLVLCGVPGQRGLLTWAKEYFGDEMGTRLSKWFDGTGCECLNNPDYEEQLCCLVGVKGPK